MSIPDGEYDLDLSILTQDVADVSSVGLRYQFVPPTVDRNQPVKAYELGRECILEVPLTDIHIMWVLKHIFYHIPRGNQYS